MTQDIQETLKPKEVKLWICQHNYYKSLKNFLYEITTFSSLHEKIKWFFNVAWLSI